MSVRTVKRDLHALEAAGLPVWSRPGPGGGCGLTEQSTLPPINLTASQAVALLAAVAAAGDAPYADLARSGVAKVLDALNPVTRERSELLAGRVWVDSPELPPRIIMSAVETAMAEQVVVRLEYLDRGVNRTRRDVEPILFASTRGQWYLVGWCRLREGVRWFSLNRIQQASVTRTPCTGHTLDEVGTPPATAGPVNSDR